jgi:hypothetical protein
MAACQLSYIIPTRKPYTKQARALECTEARRGPLPYGTQALARRHAHLPQMRTDFWPSGAGRMGPARLWDPRTGTISLPRPRFARPRVPPAFSRLLQTEFGAVQIEMGEAEAKERCARSRRGASHAPCVQRSQRSLRVLFQPKYRLLGQALNFGDGR